MLAAVFTAGASLAVAGLFSSFFGSSFTAVVGASVLTVVVVAALVAAVVAVADGGGVLKGKNQVTESRGLSLHQSKHLARSRRKRRSYRRSRCRAMGGVRKWGSEGGPCSHLGKIIQYSMSQVGCNVQVRSIEALFSYQSFPPCQEQPQHEEGRGNSQAFGCIHSSTEGTATQTSLRALCNTHQLNLRE